MKQIILTAALALSAIANAQSSKTFQVSGYDEIAVSGPYTVELVLGAEGNITASGDQKDLDNLIVTSDGDNLVIKQEKWIKGLHSKSVKITVPVKDISEIALSGSGSVTANFPLKADHFEAALSGSGRITLEVNAKEMEAAVSGSGRIELSGNSGKLESSLSGSGRIAAYELKAENVEAAVSGSGETQVNCSEVISARVSGSGRISYKGDPKKEDTKVSGSGKIVKS